MVNWKIQILKDDESRLFDKSIPKTKEEKLIDFLNSLPEKSSCYAKVAIQVTGDTSHSFHGPNVSYRVIYPEFSE